MSASRLEEIARKAREIKRKEDEAVEEQKRRGRLERDLLGELKQRLEPLEPVDFDLFRVSVVMPNYMKVEVRLDGSVSALMSWTAAYDEKLGMPLLQGGPGATVEDAYRLLLEELERIVDQWGSPPQQQQQQDEEDIPF